MLLLAGWSWRAENSALLSRLSVVAQDHRESLDRRIASLHLTPRLLAGDPRLKEALRSPDAVAAANQLLARAQEQAGLAFVFLMASSGLTVAASNHADAISFIGQNYGFRPYFRGAVEGEETRHFAVGATTGRPGYFVAVPVFAEASDALPIGVVVGKIELDELISSWRSREEQALVFDAQGVSILSTNEDLLYLPGRTLDEATLGRIRTERPYQPSDSARFDLPEEIALEDITRVVRVSSTQGRTAYSAGAALLESLGWTVLSLQPRSVVWVAWLRNLLVLTGLAAIAFLGLRVFAHRQRMALIRANQAQELERLVDVRTRELESAQRALIARSNFEMLGRMSAAINHEVNQPLASLRLDLASARTLLERGEPDIAAISEVVIDADRTTKRIGRVIETLRRVAGPLAELGEHIDVANLLNDLRDTIERERPGFSRALRMHPVPGNLARPVGNAVLLQQALLNLVYNAFDAVVEVESPCVEIRCRLVTDELPQKIVVQVSDNGSGVPAEIVERLFEPFAGTSGGATSLGLGLALAQEIAGRHDGHVVYEALDVGSRFELQLPVPSQENRASPVLKPFSTDDAARL